MSYGKKELYQRPGVSLRDHDTEDTPMAKTFCKIIGVIMLAVGILGFIAPGMMGMHLSGAHNLIHIVTGAIAAFLGFRGSYHACRRFCFAFGAVYALLGIAGFASGPGVPTTMGDMAQDDHLLKLIPGTLEFGTADSVVHIILGLAFLAVGFARPRISERLSGAVDSTKQKLRI